VKEGYWEKFISDMEYNLYGDQNKIWKMLRMKKSIKSQKDADKHDNLRRVDHFENLY